MAAAQKFLKHWRDRRVAYYADRAAKRRAEAEARTSPRNPTASAINLDCRREMYHRIVDWAAMPDFSADAQERMDNGDVAAAAAAMDLRDMGYEVIETESPMKPFRRGADGKVIITGRLDFKLNFGGTKIPVEVKDTNQNVFQSVDTFEDLARWWWTRKYQSQILIYLLQNNEPEGLLLMVCQGRKKWLRVVLEDHLDLAEESLAAAELTVADVESGTPPPYTTDVTACRRCWAFGRVCNPPIEQQGASLMDDSGELYEVLAIEAETEDAHRRYEAAKKRRNEILKALVPAEAFAAAKPKEIFFRGICGDFAIALKKLARKGYEVKAAEYQQAEIVRVAAAAAREEVA
jgi:hypothetical protein